MWIGLELNLIMFLGLIFKSENLKNSERIVKYFLVQGFGSSLLILSFFFRRMRSIYEVIIFLSLGIKLGVVPLHYWVFEFINGLRWGDLFLFLGIQKINPILLITYLLRDKVFQFLVLIIVIRRVVGGLGGYNQSELRKILGYSRIRHLG